MGKELGLPDVDKEVQPEISPRTGAPLFQSLPKIYIGDASRTPRWLIRPVGSESGSHNSPQSSASSSSRLPPLGQLRWEFDPGPPAKHGQDENQLREYAYQYLHNSLCDPVVRDELRVMIWNSRYAAIVAHVEDPLPIPPPPPHFKDQRPSDYVKLRPPISDSAPDDYIFMYPAYERPSLAARTHQSKRTRSMAHPGSTGHSDPYYTRYSPMGSNGSYASVQSSIVGSMRTRTSTSSSTSTHSKDYLPEYDDALTDDHHHLLRIGEYKWIWILLTILILAMMLCLFLYAFGILR
ncbi:hypothetical protein BJX76DRAFT_362194 [Aspergillus varians]